MNAAILIVTWNGQAHVRSCLEALLEQISASDSVWIVDNASADNTLAELEAFQTRFAARACQFTIVRNAANTGFTLAANQGLRLVMRNAPQSNIVVILNQDTVVDPGWLAALKDVFLCYPHVGAVGCKIFYPDGLKLQHAGGVVHYPRLTTRHYGHHQSDAPEYDLGREVDFVTGAAITTRIEALKQVGVFNEIFAPGYYEDVDLCVRLKRKGWQVMYCPSATLKHVESASFTDHAARWTLSHRNRVLFAAQFMTNPHFRQAFEEAELAFLKQEAQQEELRHLSLAYGRAMLSIGLRLMHQDESGSFDRNTLKAIIDMIARLRQTSVRLSCVSIR